MRRLVVLLGVVLGGTLLGSCGNPCADLEQEICDLWFACAGEEERLAVGMTDEAECLTIVSQDLDFLEFDGTQCEGWLAMADAESCSWPWIPESPSGDDDSASDDDSAADDDD